MSERLYRIKPLEWHDSNRENWQYSSTTTVLGGMKVEFVTSYGPPGFWRWGYCFDEYYDEDVNDCDSLEDGKAKAEEFYLSRILSALEEVR